ncbi:peptide deformylase [Sphingobacterium bovistauri]|uniref:Peptide deformylase n=1 Tax=Sphingobacterium bovistauri TaxID=2781959 RepID=A0ABS7Z1X9_9SPHI|nr:peptide deformylase [Sphingobacterium bovistauri]MCA5004141.1 peptide deformylase [Sphingobacterium bovistauri]
MRLILYLLLLIIPFELEAQSYEQQIDSYRAELKSKFEKDDFGPIKKENVVYLDYFKANSTYKVKAKVEPLFGEKTFRMPTYDGTSNEYKRYAFVHFELLGQQHTLTVYQSVALFQNPQYKDYLFLPFLDSSNGDKTYAGGRYLELDASKIKDGEIEIDFNKSYNPYCAYSSGYRCPQPPAENFLSIAIEAGEKMYKGPKNERIVNKAMAKNFNEKESTIIKGGDANSKLHVYQTTNERELLVLKATSSDIKIDDPLLPTLEKRMLLTVQDPQHAGVGIAAPQIGINKNLIWVQRFDKENEPFEFFINPKIIWRSKLIRLGTEGCLSIPDRREDIERSYSIRLQYWDKTGNIIEENIEGFTAVIFQHEVDHLYGILYPDRLEEQDKKEHIELNEKIKFSIENGITRP